jgi:hypothetical protein
MKKKRESETPVPRMPFDDALRKILNAPPQHKKAQKPAKKAAKKK